MQKHLDVRQNPTRNQILKNKIYSELNDGHRFE